MIPYKKTRPSFSDENDAPRFSSLRGLSVASAINIGKISAAKGKEQRMRGDRNGKVEES